MTSSKPAKRSPSGAHPAVVAYRDKLQSLNEHTSADLTQLDSELAEYLESIRTPPPPPPDSDDRETPTVPER